MLIFIWFLLSVFAGVLASNKGRSFGGFFLLALVLSPLVGLIAAAIAKPDHVNIAAEAIDSGEAKKCPYCAETIKTEATICRFCQRELDK